MSVFIIAQTIGLAGYGLYCLSPRFEERMRVLQCEVLAYVILGTQWYLLDQFMLLTVNFTACLSALIALPPISKALKARLFVVLCVCTGFVISRIWQGQAIDYFAGLALCFMIASKFCADFTRLRVFAGLSGLCFLGSSALALCYPAALFNAIFVAGHGHKLWAAWRRPSPPDALPC